ncbi:MAG TPA: DMT family transporter [Thermomicrobiales bacterium]|nr:DMT family transporter [Thermomicrobiales bacterium]
MSEPMTGPTAAQPSATLRRADGSQRRWVGAACLLGAALIWGFVPTSTRYVVQTLSPGNILLARFLVGAVAAVILFSLFKAPLPPRKLIPHAVALGLLGQLGFNVPLAYGIQHVEAGTAALISGLSSVFIAVLAVPVLGERLQGRVVVGLLLALSGSVVVSIMSGGDVSLSRDQAFGSLLVLLSATLWAVYSVFVKPWLGRIPPTSIPMLGSIAGLPLMLPLGASGMREGLGDLTWTGWLGVAQFTVAASVVAPILWAVGLQRGEASRAGLYLYLTPLFGVIISAILLKEPVTLGTIAGGGLIVAGVVLATLPALGRQRLGARAAGRS